MKHKIFTFIVLQLIVMAGISSCSNKDFDPEDYVTSILSGEYSSHGPWHLTVTVNGSAVDNYDSVRFTSDKLVIETGDFKFVNVIPGDAVKEFKNIPLTNTDQGLTFTIDYMKGEQKVVIKGLITFGSMTVDITM